ncbi:unnamed protein product [Leptosia nina]|uniref:Uncharacterized protein n=1 Tax=Leptosia nina TaxID=320188 RepID=A0AAV1JTL7_9NEOP
MTVDATGQLLSVIGHGGAGRGQRRAGLTNLGERAPRQLSTARRRGRIYANASDPRPMISDVIDSGVNREAAAAVDARIVSPLRRRRLQRSSGARSVESGAWGARGAGRNGGERARGDVRRLLPVPVRPGGRALLPPRAALPVRPGEAVN